LLLITLPFAILGIALGYVFSPKTVDSITALLIPVGILLSGLVPIKDPKFFQDIVVTSPFFHYGQTLKFIAGIPDDGQLMLHLLWLAFYGVVAGLIAQFAYQRDRVSQ
jgi:ABC-2 type transport system ATP-binding protein